jgi:TolB-like protein
MSNILYLMLTQNMNIRLSLFLMIILNNQIFAQSSRSVSMENDSKSSSIGKYHAIIISENQYLDDKIPDLTDPKNDADKLTSILISKYFFNQKDIIHLLDPTRGQILDAIEIKQKKLSQDDNLIIFYAGHGYWAEDLKMGYWLPSDAKVESKSSWISNNDLTLYLNAFQCNHILLISDACFSGGIFKARSISDMNPGTKRLYELKSRQAITSGNLEKVPDNSVFMRFFLKELELNKSVFYSTDQLFAKIRPNIQNNSNTLPLFGVIHNTGDEGGEFIFYSPLGDSTIQSEESKELVSMIQKTEKKEVRSILSSENKILNTPKRVAIINFDNSTGKISEYGDIGGPLRDMLISDLTDVKNISMVDRQALEKVLNEQNLNNSNRFDQNTSTKLGKLLGAEVIITGTYFEFFGSLRVDAKFINVETGQILYSVGVDGSREKLLDLRIALANKIVEKIK